MDIRKARPSTIDSAVSYADFLLKHKGDGLGCADVSPQMGRVYLRVLWYHRPEVFAGLVREGVVCDF